MRSTYKIVWKPEALEDYLETLKNVENYWSLKIARKLSNEINHTLDLISQNSDIFPVVFEKERIHRAVILKLNSLSIN